METVKKVAFILIVIAAARVVKNALTPATGTAPAYLNYLP